LFQYFRSHPVGEVFAAPFDVVLSNHDVVEPDLIVLLWSRTQNGPLGRTALLRRVDRSVLTSALLPDFALSLDELFA
jgi:hypothetical protein